MSEEPTRKVVGERGGRGALAGEGGWRVGEWLLMGVGAVLVGTAGLKVMSLLHSTRWLGQVNPVLGVSERVVLVVAVVVELAVGGVLLLRRLTPAVRVTLACWMAATFVVYRIGAQVLGESSRCSCPGNPVGWWRERVEG